MIYWIWWLVVNSLGGRDYNIDRQIHVSSSPPPTETTDKDIPVVSTPVQSLLDTGLPVIALTTAVCPLIDNRL